ncbi:DUF3500 domain-containing protein [Pantoea sp. LMR881]|uniref:DUF3500 domain-containing protein n=1 Tax=Pantoea sp. LMR881 TaxID=3014336 RepID=UPI0022AE5955|nr:DUF3500 domain-containing protein [Pantoea sp. LMR881]MCZ4061635.1 DUF3500 domain-containing protein [Pantoea sp. LMR881]
MCYPIEAKQWRAWYNPEIPLNDYGIRLEETSPATRETFLACCSSCTSARGFTKAQQLMDANQFLLANSTISPIS